MRIGTPTLLARVWIVLAGALVLPSPARAGWGEESWGTLVWGAAVPAVPTLEWFGLAVLAAGLAATAAWMLRKRRPALGLTVVLVLLAVPLGVVAGTVTMPNVFTNGTPADADLVNENFDLIQAAVNDNDARTTTAQNTADAAAAGHTTDTKLTNAEVAAAATAEGFVTGAHTTDTNTTYTAGAGLNLVDTSFSADPSLVQTRVSGNCAVGEAITAIAANGTVTCAAVDPAPASRFELCSNGLTVADHDTGLLWEKKTGTVTSDVFCETAPIGCPDPHDVNNRYEWSNSASAPDGNAFTDFLLKLNDPVFGSASGATEVTGCFVGHCDWRLPVVTELTTIADCGGGMPCVDAVFGTTASSFYWSASTITGSPNSAWVSGFDSGFTFAANKTGDNYVRAVRAGSCTY